MKTKIQNIKYFTKRMVLMLLLALLTAATAWAGTVDVTVNVTGSGSVSIGNQTATAGNPLTTTVDDGASVTLTFAPDAGNIVTSAKLSYKPSKDGTSVDDIAISGSTATFQMPNDIWNGTGVTINVTFGAGLVGGADEASAVALTDATVSNLAGGYYKVESDISFDHTLNLIGDTYLVIASGAKMTVSSSEYGINGESYALNVLGEGTLNVTTTGSYKIAVDVSSYTQSGCSVNLTTSFMGMRCLNGSFNISGGSFTTNGSTGIWPDNAVNISGGKLEASKIDANINLSYSSTDDYIKVDTYTNGKTMTIANGQTFTDGATNYSGTIENLSTLNGKKLFPFVYTHLTVRAATCTEVGIKKECWQRSSDGKYFSDANGTNELNASDVEIPMIAHTGVHNDATDTHIAYWQCSMCGKYFSNEACTTEITEEDTKIYRTITIADGISSLVTSNVDKAVAGTTVTLTVSHLIDASTLRVNDGSVALTDAGNGTYTFTVPAADVTVTASTATTYSVNLPANMEIVSATITADGDGKYISGTVVTFKASFSYTASNVHDGANTLTADGSGYYSVTVGTADITVTATIEHSSNIDLSQAPGDFTVVDGDILTAATSHTVTIAENAKITLSNATISGGIVCDGTAEITLVGTNSVTGASFKAGIQVGGFGTTLTIKGNGSLTANGGNQSAGIGLSRAWNPDDNVIGGDIIIEGGNITANGGSKWGAGIGTGVIYGGSKTARLGNITIKGGTVKATGGTSADGIGTGFSYSGCTNEIGTITITTGIDIVDASSIKNSGSIVYKHEENDVTASTSDYFTIIENGNRRIIVQKVTPTIADVPDQTYTGSAITPEPTVIAGSLSLTKGTDYEYSYTNNTNVGTAKVRATFQGDYVSLGSVEKEFKIVKSMTNNDISITIPSQTWNGYELTPDIIVKDGETVLTENTDYTVTPPSGPIQDSGNHAYTITGMGNYAGSREAMFTITPYLADQFGAVYVYQDQNGKTALLEGTSVEPVDIPSVINKTVNHVTNNRVFTPGVASTVMLPFNYTCSGEEGGTFYKFVGVKKENDKWVATMQETGNDANNEGTLIANTPYLFMPTATEMTFPNINGSVTLSTEGGGNCVTADPGSHWTFKGTYWFKEWNSNDYYTAEEIGRAYGFAGVAKDGINVGDFVRVASGAKIRPMRAYLLWNDMPNAANARALTRGTAATEEELPQSITVRLVGSNGEVTSIGEIDTKTGDVTFDGWYTIDGVRLSGKPSKSGLYINNGRKVIIK